MKKVTLKSILKKLLRVSLYVALILVLVPLILDIAPINSFVQARLHARVQRTISRLLGRQIRGGPIELTTLSGIGFNMDSVFVSEDPGFGDEQFLYAGRIHFVMSWHSFVSRRLELSSITLRQASINCVRNSEGHWNFETLFSRGNVPAPAGSPVNAANGGEGTGAPAAPSFPFKVYFVESRIDFKEQAGNNPKSAYFVSIINGSLEPAWFTDGLNFDLTLRPSRTDIPMENSGTVRATGSLGPFRGQSLWDAVVQGRLRMEKYPYSDVVALLAGRVSGWHGSLAGTANFHGQLNSGIQGAAQLNVVDLHSEAVQPRDQFQSATIVLPKVELQIGRQFLLSEGKVSMGGSSLDIDGSVDFRDGKSLDLEISGRKIRADDTLNVLRGFSAHLDPSLRVAADLDMDLLVQGDWQSPAISMSLAISQGEMNSQLLERPIPFNASKIMLRDGALTWDPIRMGIKNTAIQVAGGVSGLWGSPHLIYSLSGRETSIAQMEGILRTFMIWPTAAHAEGIADFNLTWGPAGKKATTSSLTGTVVGRNLTLRLGSTENVRVASARFDSRAGVSQLAVTKLIWGQSVASVSAQFAGLDFHVAQVSVNASFLDIGQLIGLGRQAAGGLFPASSIPSGSGSGPAISIHWSGIINSDWLYLYRIQGTNFRSGFLLTRETLQLPDYSLSVYAGQTHGSADLSWPQKHPRLRVDGAAEGVRWGPLLRILAPAIGGIGGHVSGRYQLSGEKFQNQAWADAITAHVAVSSVDVKSTELSNPAGVSEVRNLLKIGAVASDSNSRLDLDLDYAPSKMTFQTARISRPEFIADFKGECSRQLDLNLTGNIERMPPLKSDPASVGVKLTGPLTNSRLIISRTP
ncbi:MAG: hypothetical protein PHX83_01090 [Acidobacteriia bacterium]|nr:hypothetical protein [Terriglobia bacterium]